MLVLTRKVDERVRLELPDGQLIWVSVVKIDRGKTRIAFVAPKDVTILREELIETSGGCSGGEEPRHQDGASP